MPNGWRLERRAIADSGIGRVGSGAAGDSAGASATSAVVGGGAETTR